MYDSHGIAMWGTLTPNARSTLLSVPSRVVAMRLENVMVSGCTPAFICGKQTKTVERPPMSPSRAAGTKRVHRERRECLCAVEADAATPIQLRSHHVPQKHVHPCT